MFTNGEIRKAIEKYQKEHPLHFGQMIDVTAIDSKEGADIISQAIEQVAKRVDEDTELWCICEMAKMYMQGVRPVYPVRPQGEWKRDNYGDVFCSNCGVECAYNEEGLYSLGRYCHHCGADMWKEGEED